MSRPAKTAAELSPDAHGHVRIMVRVSPAVAKKIARRARLAGLSREGWIRAYLAILCGDEDAMGAEGFRRIGGGL